MSARPPGERGRWTGVWLDALAFASGLATAWFAKWDSGDLVWSLWLSSFVVGYACIVWNVSGSLREFAANALADRSPGHSWVAGGAGLLVGFCFILAFFTVHFGGFHFVHSVFLATFFPIKEVGSQSHAIPSFGLYAEVFARYWIFLPIAFLAERQAFLPARRVSTDTAVTPQAIARRKRAAGGADMMAPYRNVIRMHLLIFFFAAAHFAHLDNFAIYAVVYAVYFFPWRVLKREGGDVRVARRASASEG